MRPIVVILPALLLFLGIGVAEAADATQLAESAGFLLGNTHRCGVPTERVDRAGRVIHHLIVAASYDAAEEATADARFVEIFLASDVLDPEDALIPPCATVVAQFEQLEQHHRQSGMNKWAGALTAAGLSGEVFLRAEFLLLPHH